MSTETPLERRYRRYAAKFVSDTDGQDRPAEPTDANLKASLDRCVRPARPEEYPAIRANIPAIRQERQQREARQ
jgi:hypothetical protein